MTLPTRSRLAIAVVLAGVFVSSLDLFIVNIAFPDLERSFHGADVSSLSWVLSAYAIVFAAALVPAGGWADRTGRKRAFLGNLPVGLIALLIGARVLTEIRDPARTAPDAIGAAVLAATVGLIVAAIVEGPSWGWGGSRVLGLFVAGIGGIFVTVHRARRHPAPVVEPALLRIRSVSFANLAALFFFTGFGAMVLVSVLFLTG